MKLSWFPHPWAWLRSIVLVCIVAAMALTVRWFGFYGVIVSVISNNIAIFVVGILIGGTLPFVIYAYLHSWLLGKKPEKWSRNLPAPNSIRESVTAFSVLVISILVSFIIIYPFVDQTKFDLSKEYKEQVNGVFMFICYISILYLFHIDRFLQLKSNSRTAKK